MAQFVFTTSLNQPGQRSALIALVDFADLAQARVAYQDFKNKAAADIISSDPQQRVDVAGILLRREVLLNEVRGTYHAAIEFASTILKTRISVYSALGSVRKVVLGAITQAVLSQRMAKFGQRPVVSAAVIDAQSQFMQELRFVNIGGNEAVKFP